MKFHLVFLVNLVHITQKGMGSADISFTIYLMVIFAHSIFDSTSKYEIIASPYKNQKFNCMFDFSSEFVGQDSNMHLIS